MVKKNETIEIFIDALGSEGQGIGRINNFTIFVQGGIPGDTLEILIILVKKNYAIGKLLKIINPSENRVAAKCPIFSKCGGCSLQNLKYDEQLLYKKDKVYNDIKRIGKIETTVNDTVGMDLPYFYRNKAQFPVGTNKNGEIEIGFYRQRSHQIISVENCIIQHKSNEKIISIVERFLEENKITTYDETTGKGLVRHVLTKVGFSTGEIMVCIVINGDDLPKKEILISLLSEINEIKSIVININKRNDNVILGYKVKTIFGKDFIEDVLNGITFKISPLSFYQVNPLQTEKMYEFVKNKLDLSGDEIVFDAYCGIGTISLILSKACQKVYGIEIIKEAINDAKENAKLNEISNVEFIAGDSSEEVVKLFEERKIFPDVIVVDPPRKGCENSLLESILEISPKKIAYVSCDPSTLARDLKIITDGGFEIEVVQPFDCFCQTYHVETVVILKKK